jgi:cell wall-associated NlpC family hydrolase
LIAPLLGAAVLAAVWSPPVAASPGPPGGPTNAQIQAARAKATRLMGLISADNEREQTAGESYDQANVVIGLADKQLASLHKRIRREDATIAVGKRRVERAAVEAYVAGGNGGGGTAQFASLLTNSLTNSESITTYAGVATTSLHQAVVRLVAEKNRLLADESAARTQASDARIAARNSAAARSSAAAAEQSTAAALHQVKGQLATLIEQRALAIAQQEAAEAQAAKSAAARDAYARSAEEYSNLASQLGAGNPAAAEAAEVQAALASEVGHPPLAPAGHTAAGDLAVQTAESYLGVPYVWGGAGPDGFDCSGLTMVAWAAAGVSLTHSAWYQYRETTHVPLSAIEPGDLLFYTFPDDGPNPITHVAMYVGSGPYGSETIIQAPETGETVSYSPMYYFGFVAAGQP